MKHSILIILLVYCLGLTSAAVAQSDQYNYRNFPIVVTLQFHNLAMPFHDMASNFLNMGIGIGTEFSFNGKQNWVQQINIVWYRNKHIGNGLFLYTQTAWRPTLVSNSFGELKAGAGYLFSSRPVTSYKQVNGDWLSVGKTGKCLFTIPLGISLGYNDYSSQTYLSPFASYQLLVVKDYNKSIPVVPETLIQIGSRIHPKY